MNDTLLNLTKTYSEVHSTIINLDNKNQFQKTLKIILQYNIRLGLNVLKDYNTKGQYLHIEYNRLLMIEILEYIIKHKDKYISILFNNKLLKINDSTWKLFYDTTLQNEDQNNLQEVLIYLNNQLDKVSYGCCEYFATNNFNRQNSKEY